MRILKIELQNINSLKSNEPIIIDFESEAFQNVGLYAITGPTGAGKTTILDAISIALYLQVPRFKQSHTRANLQDVVSYGASEAWVRLSFENNDVSYEASWNMRLKNKFGRSIKPVEEVRLKDISNGKILAEKKTDFKEKIIDIINLNYDQFLRSVLLAQGEFAAFLSANGKTKGELLEQITGEEIYKRIGEEINNRIYSEKRKLEEIKSKINSVDLISEEQKTELDTQNAFIENKLKEISIEISRLQTIKLWYKQSDQFEAKKIEYKENILNHKTLIEENEHSFELLEANNMAEGFRPNILAVDRINKGIKEQNLLLESLQKHHEKLIKQIATAKTAAEASGVEKQMAIQTQLDWQPKLKDVTVHDTKLDALRKLLIDLQADVKSIKKDIETNTDLLNAKNAEKKIKLSELEVVNNYITTNKNILQIEDKIIGWNERLAERNKLSIDIVKNKTSMEVNTKSKAELLQKQELCNSKIAGSRKVLLQLQQEIASLDVALEANDMKELYSQKESVSSWETALADMRAKAIKYADLQTLNTDLQNRKELAKVEKTKEQALVYEQQDLLLAKQQSLLHLEDKIELQRHIVNLEAERDKLIEGSACPLCGSLEHPMVEQYKDIDAEVSKIELIKLRAEIVDLNKSISTLQTKVAVGDNNIVNFEKHISQNIKSVEVLLQEFNQIKDGFLITEINKIDLAISQASGKKELLNAKIEEINAVIRKKEISEKKQDTVNAELAKLEKLELSYDERLKASVDIIESLQTANVEFQKLYNELVDGLLIEFAVFDYQLPAEAMYGVFIDELRAKLNLFKQNQNLAMELNGQIQNLGTELSSIDKIIADKQALLQKGRAEIENNKAEWEQEENARIKILPKGTKVEQKQAQLQNAISEIGKRAGILEDKFQKVLLAKVQNDADIENSIKALATLKLEIEEVHHDIEKMMQESNFESIDQVKSALLSADEKKSISELKKQLGEISIQLNTSIENIEQQIERHNANKNSKESREELDALIIEKSESEKQNTERIGEIRNMFAKDADIRARNKGITDQINAQQAVYNKWSKLMNVLGGSKHAFSIYVQRLTLQNLIHRANLHLLKLNERYSLKMSTTYKSGEELNFNLVDHYQTDQERLVDTSSGGEKFIISLALALGLSDLASKNVEINSLFIDEGFGTLDNNTLETVISTLETLQSQGKMIGVISHVESLKERISTQIQVHKRSNGVSEVEIYY